MFSLFLIIIYKIVNENVVANVRKFENAIKLNINYGKNLERFNLYMLPILVSAKYAVVGNSI